MEDGNEAFANTESKLASVFASEVAREQGVETPEPEAAEEPQEQVALVEPQQDQFPVVEEEAPEAPEATDQPEERLRDPETGQFTTEEKLYAGRYKTVEELERAVVEKEEFIARQGTEVGSLRTELREFLQQRQPEAPAAPQQLPANWESMLDEDPSAAADWAYDADNEYGLNEALRAWNEISPGAPRIWAQQKQILEDQAETRASISAQSANQAYADFARSHPDVDQFAAEMGEIAKQSPHLTGLLQSGDPRAQTEVLDFLYTKASSKAQARNADTLATAQKEADAERATSIRQEKEQAAVASATRTPAEKRPRSAGHEMLESIRAAYVQPWDINSGITTD